MASAVPNVLTGKWLSYLPPKMAQRAREEFAARERIIENAQKLLDRQTRLREALVMLEKYRRLERITEGLPRTTLLAGLLEFSGSLPGSAKLDAQTIAAINRREKLVGVISALESSVNGALQLSIMKLDHAGDVKEALMRQHAENTRWFEYIQRYRSTRRARLKALWRKTKALTIAKKRSLLGRKPRAH